MEIIEQSLHSLLEITKNKPELLSDTTQNNLLTTQS